MNSFLDATGVISVGPKRRPPAWEALRRELILCGATEVHRAEEATVFRLSKPVAFGPLYFIDGGEIRESSDPSNGDLSYTLSFRRSAATTAAMTYGLLGGYATYLESLWLGLMVGTVGFLWLYGFWFVLAPGRFERFIKDLSPASG